jgi:hypothetical protein
MLTTLVEGLGFRGLDAAVEAWRDQPVLAVYVVIGAPDVRVLGAVRSALVAKGDGPDALDGDVLRVQVGAATFSLPVGDVAAWASEVQRPGGDAEWALLTAEGESWSLTLFEDER